MTDVKVWGPVGAVVNCGWPPGGSQVLSVPAPLGGLLRTHPPTIPRC